MQWGHSFVERAAELHPREKVIWRRLLFFKKRRTKWYGDNIFLLASRLRVLFLYAKKRKKMSKPPAALVVFGSR